MSDTRLGLALYAGGNHVFYNAGVLKRFLEQGLKFDALATYSAGGAIIPFLLAGRLDDAVEIFRELTSKNSKNIYLSHLFSGKPVFPHDHIYSTAVQKSVRLGHTDLQDRPAYVVVSLFRSPSWAAPLIALAGLLSLTLYGATRKLTNAFFIRAFKALFRIQPLTIDLTRVQDPNERAELILGSSTMYPFIKLRRHKESFMLDGKLSMLAPIQVLDDCSHILSIHAHYTFPTPRQNLYQVFPQKKVSVSPLDYVGSEGFERSFEQGYREGLEHWKSLQGTPFFPAE